MLEKILVAIDRSEMRRDVFAKALVLAQATNANLMLLHVLSDQEEGSPMFPVYYSFLEQPVNEMARKQYQEQWDAFSKQGLDILRFFTDEATAAGVETEFNQLSGDPGKTICDLASTWEADLIIMGRRGYSGIKEIFLGSVSSYVTHHASCSVMIVQGTKQAKENILSQEQLELSSSLK